MTARRALPLGLLACTLLSGTALGGDTLPAARHAASVEGWPIATAAFYCIAVVMASLAGGWLPTVVRLTHTRLQLSMSFCGGLMLGIGLFHLLPHAFHELGSLDAAIAWLMGGLLCMFFLIRAFHFHQHEPAELREGAHDHDHDHGDHHHHHDHAPPGPMSWAGLVFGLGLHTLLDGLALGASVQADVHLGAKLLGLGTFLAILLHKPLDAMPIAIMLRARHTPVWVVHSINAGFSLLCPLGMLLFFAGVQQFSARQATIVGSALAFSAGVFLCISLSDLLPELEFHAHDRAKLSVALLLGVALAYAIGWLEPAHQHDARTKVGVVLRSAENRC